LILKSKIIMKKAKFLFTALSVLAVVGGALAFKAQSNYGAFRLWSSSGESCVSIPDLFVIPYAGEGASITIIGTIVAIGDPDPTLANCQVMIIYVAEN
jgi:hypothetical protein